MEIGASLQRAITLHSERRCVEALPEIEQALQERLPPDQQALAWRMRAWITAHELRQPGPVPIMWADRAMRAVRRVPNREFQGLTALDCSAVAIFGRDYPHAHQWLTVAFNADLQPADLWRAHHNSAWCSLLAQNYGLALDNARTATELAPESLDAAVLLAVVEIHRNRPGAALKVLEAAEQACQRGETHHVGHVAWATGWAMWIAGEVDTASDRLSIAAAHAEMDADAELKARIHATLAGMAASQGHLDTAYQHADRAQFFAERAGRLDIHDMVNNALSPVIDRQALDARWGREEK